MQTVANARADSPCFDILSQLFQTERPKLGHSVNPYLFGLAFCQRLLRC